MQKGIAKKGDTALRSHVKLVSATGLISFLSTLLVWIQTEELGAPQSALYLAFAMNVCFVLTPLAFLFRDNSRPVRAQTQGALAIVAGIGIIFGLCGAPLFFYFVFASIPISFRFFGLGLVGTSGLVWTMLCWRDQVRATEKSGLLHSAAYAEYAEYIVYDDFKAGDILSRHLYTRSPISWPYLIAFLVVAPFGTFFYRFFGDYIGHHGMVWVIGFLMYPLYLVFISGIVKVYRQTVLIPKILKKQKGKPVYWCG